jgi:hypothetical protein
VDNLSSYFSSFFNTPEEKSLFMSKLSLTPEEICDNSINSNYEVINSAFNALLNIKSDAFKIEVNRNATTIIDLLFKKYVTADTFVIYALEHTSIIKNIENVEYKCMLARTMLDNFNIEYFLEKYKESGCKKVFVYAAGVIQNKVVYQTFYEKLKERFISENIPVVFVLDDVQTMFIVPRDYTIFDHIIFTCHSILPCYDLGVVLSKQISNLGSTDLKYLEDFIEIYKKIITKNLNNLQLFNFIITDYLSELLQNKEISISTQSPHNIVYITINDKVVKDFIQKHIEKLEKYKIDFGEDTFLIKANFILQCKPHEIVEGLEMLKQLLQKGIKLKKQRSI